ncbi:MAG: hypothetical protein HOK77_04150 [Flavobacteriales bacterium]|nr:hypothetical protein [Flavobacteriales bacterium]
MKQPNTALSLKNMAMLVILVFSLNASGQEFLRKNLATSALERMAAQQTQGNDPMQALNQANQASQMQSSLQPLLQQIRNLKDSINGGKDSLTALDLPYLRVRIFTDTLIYGSELFAYADLGGNSSFAPNLQLPAPSNYTIGPGDKLAISIYGFQEANHQVSVNRNGRITLPYAGVIAVGGLSLEAAKARIKQGLARSGYASLNSGKSNLELTLAEVRSIQVTVLGAKRPGAYQLPAVATVMHALYQSGGPANKGSYREIALIRDGKTLQTMDLYDLLTHGNPVGDITIKDGDVIHIPTYGHRINLSGKFKKPGLFEVLDGESLEDMMPHAGGFTEAAYTKKLSLLRTGDEAIDMVTIDMADASTFMLKGGDVVIAAPILKETNHRVVIAGAVKRPGYYGWLSGMHASDLLSLADGLQANAISSKAVLFRHLKDGSMSYQDFQPGNPDQHLELMDNDSLFVVAWTDFSSKDSVTIAGAVNGPTTLPYGTGMTIHDAILLGGGLLEGANLDRVELSTPTTVNGRRTGNHKIKHITLDPEMTSDAGNAPIQPGSIISIPFDPLSMPSGYIRIKGAANAPGSYALQSRMESLASVVKRSGGPAPWGDKKYAMLFRLSNMDMLVEQRIDSSLFINNIQKDKFDTMAVDMSDLKTLKETYVKSGDVFYIPDFNPYVNIQGAVLNKNSVIAKPNKRAGYYIHSAGGLTDNAIPGRAYVIYPNGMAKSTRRFLGLRLYPLVSPGCTVVVPSKDPLKGKGWNASEWSAFTGILSAVSTVSLTILTFLR